MCSMEGEIKGCKRKPALYDEQWIALINPSTSFFSRSVIFCFQEEVSSLPNAHRRLLNLKSFLTFFRSFKTSFAAASADEEVVYIFRFLFGNLCL